MRKVNVLLTMLIVIALFSQNVCIANSVYESEITFLPIGWETLGIGKETMNRLMWGEWNDYGAHGDDNIRLIEAEVNQLRILNTRFSLYGMGNHYVWSQMYGETVLRAIDSIGFFAGAHSYDSFPNNLIELIREDSANVNNIPGYLLPDNLWDYTGNWTELPNPSNAWQEYSFSTLIRWLYHTGFDHFDHGSTADPGNVSWNEMYNDIIDSFLDVNNQPINGLRGYFIHAEPLHGISQYKDNNGDYDFSFILDSRRCTQDIINNIRTFDTDRPIVIFVSHRAGLTRNDGNLYWYNLFEQPDGDIYSLDELLPRGWNVLVNWEQDYFRWYPGAASNNASIELLRHWVLRDSINRDLSRSMQTYRKRFIELGLDGPRPEWWHDIVNVRGYKYSNNDDIYYQATRRPTKYEYRMQAYSAIAAGARGILAYAYGSQNIKDFGIVDTTGFAYGGDFDIEPDPGPRPVNNELDDQNDHISYLFEGVTSNLWNYYKNGPWLSHITIPDNSPDHDYFSQDETEFSYADVQGDPNNLNDPSWRDTLGYEYFRIPYSEDRYHFSEEVKDISGFPLERSTYRGYNQRYPFDRMKDLNAELAELLPLVRKLRWWWYADCIDISSTGTYRGDDYQQSSLQHMMNVATFDNLNSYEFPDVPATYHLSDYFSLSSVVLNQNNHGYVVNGNLYLSPIAVGMFDDPDNSGSSEYYMFVNRKCWTKDGNEMVDSSTAITFKAYFDVDLNLVDDAITLWSGDNYYSEIISQQWVEGDSYVEIALMPGDAILIKLPKATVWTQDITANTTWREKVWLGENITVSGNATLTIEPGTVIESDGKIINFSNGGKFESAGTVDTPVVFDSVRLCFLSSASNLSTISNCRFENAPDPTALNINCTLTEPIDNVAFINQARHAVHIESEGSVEFTNCTFEKGVWDESTSGIGVRFSAGDVTINNCQFSGYSSGIYAIGASSLSIRNNTLHSCSNGVSLEDVYSSVIDHNHFSNCTRGIELHDSDPYITRNYIDAIWYSLYSVEPSTPVLRLANGNAGQNYFGAGNIQPDGSPTLIPINVIGSTVPDFVGGYNNLDPCDWGISMKINFGGHDNPNEIIYPDTTYQLPDTWWGIPPTSPFFHLNAYLRGGNTGWGYGLVMTDHYYSSAELDTLDPNIFPFENYPFQHYLDDTLVTDYLDSLCTGENPLDDLCAPESGYLGTDFGDDYPCTPLPVNAPTTFHEDYIDACLGIENGDYSGAVTLLTDIVNNAPYPNLQIGSINKLKTCHLEDENTNVLSFLNSVADNSGFSRKIRNAARYSIANIHTFEGNYQDAIDLYSGMMTDTDASFLDSTLAGIYSGGVYLAAAAHLNPDMDDSDYSIRLGQLTLTEPITGMKPTSLTQYNSHNDSLLAQFDQDYSCKNYDITENTTWGEFAVILDNDVTVSAGAVLNILPGTAILGNNVKIHVYGEINATGLEDQAIYFDSQHQDSLGIEIILHDGSSTNSTFEYCEFSNSPVGLNLEVSLVDDISYCRFKDCEKGVRMVGSTPYENSIVDCAFESTSEFTDTGVQFYNSGDDSEIKRCTFTGAMMGISVNSGNATIEDCYFDNPEGLQTSAEIYAIRFVSSAGKILHNAINNFPSGMLIYDSDPMLSENRIENCHKEGIWLVNDSYPDMTQAGTGAMNWLKFNGANSGIPAQIRIAGKTFPYLKSGLNNIWQAENGFAVVSDGLPSSLGWMKENYWGTDTPVMSHLFNQIIAIGYITPYMTEEQIPIEGYQTASQYDEYYLEALQLIAGSNYDDAIPFLREVALDDSVEYNRVGAISLLYTCYTEGEANAMGLMSFLEGIADSTNNLVLAHEALHTRAKLQAFLGDFDSAIEFYETVILDPNITSEDSLCAVIDAGNLYLRSIGEYDLLRADDPGDDGPKQNRRTSGIVHGDIGDLVPESYDQHESHVGEMLGMIRSAYQDRTRIVALPSKYELYQNYPNPFNPSTNIKFSLPRDSHVRIRVFNVLGQAVLDVVNRPMTAGYHTVSLNMGDYASGLYIYSLETTNHMEYKKMLLLK